MAETEATTRTCKACGETKPLDGKHFRAHRKPNGLIYERRCKVCGREDARQRMETRRRTEEGAKASRKAVAKWKRRNPDRVLDQRRQEAARKGRPYKPREDRLAQAFNRAQDRLAQRNAGEAWRHWIAERAPDCWMARYYQALGRPWANPRLSGAERWRARYETDEVFRQREIARSRVKKGRRRHRRAISDDGTVDYENLLAERGDCPYCGAGLLAGNRTLDHLDPLSRDGEHSASNLQVCCQACNSSKGARPFVEWIEQLSPKQRVVAVRVYTAKRGAPPQQACLSWGPAS